MALDGLRGESPQVAAIRTQVAQLLTRQAGGRRLPPILILGETGTGKGLLALCIHQAGLRRDGPLVSVNCAAIPETLLEVELFGYERGAFTDARQGKAGLVQTAEGGTLFLDEIGLLPAAMQGKLLSVLEDRVVRRLGSTRAESVDLALVAATSVDLKRAVSERRFREDLYHRLAVITLELPPLRDRGGDILVLAQHFLARASVDYGLSPRVLTADAGVVLTRYRWPGNVRELANAMERVVLLSDTEEICAAMLGFLSSDASSGSDPIHAGAPGSLDNAVRARIQTALRETGGNIRRTAAALGISRNTLRARMDRYGLRQHQRSQAARARTAEQPSPGDPSAPLHWEGRHLAFLRARLLPSSTVGTTRALDLITEKVRSFGGRIEEAGPTGVIAVFGLEPVDNAPALAALAALAIENAATRARSAERDNADVVMGIHCGDHVVGRQDSALRIGVDGKASTWSALEDLVDENAARAIFVTEAVAPFLSRRFVVERVRTGERETLTLLRREHAAGAGVTRFVGRHVELDEMARALERTAAGHGQVMAIVGEAGVGKSRLVREITRGHSTDGWLILQTGAVPYGKTTAYLPVVDLLRGYFDLQDRDDVVDVREKVASKMLGLDRALEPALPAILTLLDMPVDDVRWQVFDPPERRQRMLDSVRRLLVRESQERPVLIVFEDLHWVDGESQALLDRLVETLPTAAVMLLVNYRPEYEHLWGNGAPYRALQIAPLPPESAEALLRELIGADPALASLRRLLIDRTDGNPFFLEECVRAMVETGILAGERGAYRLRANPPSLEVPATVRAVLGARIDRLAPPEKRLVQAAAVIGKDVPLALLRAITDLPDDDLGRHLSHLQAAEFLYDRGLGWEPEYTFKHPLTHEVAYGSLLPDRRRALHASVVEAIETLHPHRLTEQFERLAHHAARGELWDKALLYFRRAGAKALARSAYREAAGAFDLALETLGHLPPSTETLQRTIDLRIKLYWALFPVGEYDSLLSNLEAAEGLAQTLGDQSRLGAVSALLASFSFVQAKHGHAIDHGQRARAIGIALNDVSLQLQANFFLGQAYQALGQYSKAADSFAANLEAPPTDLMGTMYVVLSCAWSAMSLAELGEFTDARARAERALDTAEALGDHFDLINALGGTGMVCLLKGDAHKAISPFERCRALCQTARNRDALIYATACLGLACALSGRVDEGLILLEGSVAQGGRTRVFGQSRWLTYLGQAYVQGRRVEPALERAQLALDLARENRERGHEAYAIKLLGDIASRPERCDEEAAERYYREAITLAEELGMRPLLAHCHLGLGMLSRRTGKHDQAKGHLGTATTMYRAMGMTYWLERIAAETAA